MNASTTLSITQSRPNGIFACSARLLFTATLLFVVAALAQNYSTAPAVKDLNTTRVFPDIQSKSQWTTRAREIREEVTASCGLVPFPEKTPLQSKVFDRVERDGYTIEKVYFQSYPGFYVAGNLYRPRNAGTGPFPGVLNPHGHWSNGRMADEPDGSLAARCIHFARQGMVAFSYDMVGYNDTFFKDHGAVPTSAFYARHRRFGTNQTDQLWNISLMGLQTWNSIRALDFLASLPDVDSRRLACTGESGGGTQTYMLGAIDNRLAVQAPVVMVSSTMQGGCSCENAPGLRVRYSNMEIAAAAAPRPQMFVAATGDWTRFTMAVEGPAVAGIYRLLGVPERFHYVRFDFGHNYNQTSREAVYGWFNKWLLGAEAFTPVPERPYTKEPDAELLVFPDNQLPTGARTESELVGYLKTEAQIRWEALVPRTLAAAKIYRETLLPGWNHVLQADVPGAGGLFGRMPDGNPGMMSDRAIWRVEEPDHVIQFNVTLPSRRARKVVVLAAEDPRAAERDLGVLRTGLLNKGWGVVVVNSFGKDMPTNAFANFYTTYNRTRAQQGAADLVAVCAHIRSSLDLKQLVLCGLGAAGLWSILAAPAADAVAADCLRLQTSRDEALLAPNAFCPGLRCIGGFEGAALLAVPNPLLLHNTGTDFSTRNLRASYDALKAPKKLIVRSDGISSRDVLTWILRLP
jgi:dienelactone hydrolase